jgi:rhodanese-related sulfurtransferase
MESSSFLLKDEAGADKCVFTGDTLFIGDVGRPDLAQKAADMTSEQLAAMLFNSLRTKLMPLADAVVVYPAHGAGSPCGKAMSAERHDTLGNQKLTNYALRADMTEAEFVAEVLDGQGAAPKYFAATIAKNKGGADEFAEIVKRSAVALTADALEALIADGVAAFDPRDAGEFCAGHVPKTQFAGLGGMVAMWTSRALPDVSQRYAIVAPDEGARVELVSRLARVGYDNCVGHFPGGVAAWAAAGKKVAVLPEVSAQQYADILAAKADVQTVDVRGPGEHRNSHLPNASHQPLCGGRSSDPSNVDAASPAYVYCAGGYRSVIFASHILRQGFAGELVNITGGYGAMSEVPALVTQMAARKCGQ